MDLPFDQARALLEMHIVHAHPVKDQVAPAVPVGQQPKAEKLTKPKLRVKDGQITEEALEYFKHQWGAYKRQVNLQAATSSIWKAWPGWVGQIDRRDVAG